MASSNLSVVGSGSSGTQGTTGNPQTLSASGGTQSSKVQPGTSTNLLNNIGGQPLTPTVLPTINLSKVRALPSTTAPASVASSHHVPVVDFAIPVLLIVLSVIMFWYAGRSVKTTT